MADFDVQYSTTPQNANTKPRGASIAAMKSALQGATNGASYPDAVILGMSERDLQYACKVEGLTVAGN